MIRACLDAAPARRYSGELRDIAAATDALAKSPAGRFFFDVDFGLFHQASNVSWTEVYFSITDRSGFKDWARDYLLPTLRKVRFAASVRS